MQRNTSSVPRRELEAHKRADSRERNRIMRQGQLLEETGQGGSTEAPSCIECGVAAPSYLEAQHVPGETVNGSKVVICGNCYSKLDGAGSDRSDNVLLAWRVERDPQLCLDLARLLLALGSRFDPDLQGGFADRLKIISKTRKPICVICGETHPRSLEAHHVAGEAVDGLMVVVCRNHHRKLSEMQRWDHSKNTSLPQEVERMRQLCLGVSDLLLVYTDHLEMTGKI